MTPETHTHTCESSQSMLGYFRWGLCTADKSLACLGCFRSWLGVKWCITLGWLEEEQRALPNSVRGWQVTIIMFASGLHNCLWSFNLSKVAPVVLKLALREINLKDNQTAVQLPPDISWVFLLVIFLEQLFIKQWRMRKWGGKEKETGLGNGASQWFQLPSPGSMDWH